MSSMSNAVGGSAPTRAEYRWHDILRLFLILQVVLGHLAAISLPPVSELLRDGGRDWFLAAYRLAWRFGPQSAYLFVFLSGFMVAGSLLQRAQSNEALPFAPFLRRRLRRLWPIAAAALILTLLIDKWALGFPGVTALYRNGYAYDMVAAINPSSFVGNLFFLQPIVVPAFGSNGPLWTLGYIAQYYVLGWCLARAWASNRVLGALAVICLLLAMAVVRPEWAVLFVGWLIGGWSRTLLISRRSQRLALVVGCAAFVGSSLVPPLWSAGLSILVGVLLTQGIKILPPFGAGAKLRKSANESFVVYAVHYPVILAVYSVIFRADARSLSDFALLVAVSVVAVAVSSLVVSRVVSVAMQIRSKGKDRND